jgi:ribosomal protein L31
MKDIKKTIYECSMIREYFIHDITRHKERTINIYVDVNNKTFYTGHKKSMRKIAQIVNVLYNGTEYENYAVKFEGRFASKLPNSAMEQQSVIDIRKLFLVNM